MTVTAARFRGAAVVAACAMVVTLGAGTPALAGPLDGAATGSVATATPEAAPNLPPGWALAGTTLTWTSPTRIPLGDARLEVVVGARTLGVGVLSRNQRSSCPSRSVQMSSPTCPSTGRGSRSWQRAAGSTWPPPRTPSPARPRLQP